MIRLERQCRSTTGDFASWQMRKSQYFKREELHTRYVRFQSLWFQYEVPVGMIEVLGPAYAYFRLAIQDSSHGLWKVFLTECCC